MKKILLALAGCFLAYSANATLYVVGDDQGWNISSPTKVELNGENNYVFTVKKSFKMSTTNPNGNWDTFNGAAKTPSTALQKVQTQTVNLSNSQANVNLPYGDGNVEFTVTVNSDFTQATFTGASAPTGGFDNVYIRGYNGNWDANASSQLATTDGVIYTKSGLTITAGFKIADASYGSINYGYTGQFPLNQETTLENGTMNNISIAGMPIVDATVEFNLTKGTLKVTGTATGNPDDVDMSSWYFNLNGDYNDWGSSNGVQPGTSKTVSWTNQAIGNGEFEIAVWDGSADIYYGGAGAVALNTPTKLYRDGGHCTIAGATQGQSFDATYNIETNEITITAVGGSTPEIPDMPEKLYVIGTIEGNGWEVTNVAEMTNDGEGLFVAENVTLAENGGFCGFAITGGGSTWDEVNALRFGPAVQDSKAVLGENTDIAMGDLSWSIDPGTYTFTFNYEAKVLTVEGESHVDPDPDPNPGNTILYLLGDVNEWTASEEYAFTNNEDGTYTYSIASLSGDFKIADSNWKIDLGGDAQGADVKAVNAVLGENTLYQGSSVNLTTGSGWKNVKMTLSYTEGDASAILKIEATVDESDLTLYVIGSNVNGQIWTLAQEDAKMTKTADGVYEWQGTTLGSGFKINDGTWGATYNIGAGDGPIQIDTPYYYTISENSSDIMFDDFAVVNNPKVVIDMNQGTIVLTGQQEGEVVFALYLRGTMNDWGATDDWKFSTTDNENYTLSNITLEIGTEFKIASGDWNGQYTYTYTTSAIELDQEYIFENLTGENDNTVMGVSCEAATITYNINTHAFKINGEITDGIEGIEAEDGEAVYYNLQGQKVVNPDKGIYIKVAGGKAVKVVK